MSSPKPDGDVHGDALMLAVTASVLLGPGPAGHLN